jgi:hypothetical protein
MTWRVAQSLLVLRDQLNAAYPGRNKASDGTIGDEEHQKEVSDHNPDDDVDGDGVGEGPGVDDIVRALDVTHDPAHGLDIDQLSDALIGSRDPRISYVIANRLISGPNYGWAWADYDGDDPHENHLHLSVVGDARADDARQWNIGAAGSPAAQEGGDMDLGDKVKGTATTAHQAPRSVEEVLGDLYNAVLHNKTGGGDQLGRGEYADAPTSAILAAVTALGAKVDALAAKIGTGAGGALTADQVRTIVHDTLVRAAG